MSSFEGNNFPFPSTGELAARRVPAWPEEAIGGRKNRKGRSDVFLLPRFPASVTGPLGVGIWGRGERGPKVLDFAVLKQQCVL